MNSTVAVTNHNIYIIKIKIGDGYIFIRFFKESINSYNNYFVIDFEQPQSISTTY